MKFPRRTFLATLLGALLAAPLAVSAQRAPLAGDVDQELERLSKHNLDVGKQYYKKKAYEGAKGRLEEIVATYPEFTDIDEVYYVLAMCYLKMGEHESGKEMLQKLVDERPESAFAKKAREELEKLPTT